jgi:flagellar biosynthetic protein FliR
MPDSLTLASATLYGFLMVLARVSGALVFIPLPGIKAAPQAARAALALGFTLALFPRWPVVPSTSVTPATLVAWVASEAALGTAIGVSIAIVLEAFTFGAQILGLQAGYAYASTVDPNTEADSGILLVFAQLAAGMLFFALGLDREMLRLFALSLEKIPAGAYVLGPSAAVAVIRLGAGLFSIGLRLALPVTALLVMVDVALALLGRLNAQLQLLSLAFPAKMLTALAVLSWMAVLFPRLLLEMSAQAWPAIRRMLRF